MYILDEKLKKKTTIKSRSDLIKIKQGCGKGLAIDQRFASGIFCDCTYTQATSMDGLLGNFNENLMNKTFINGNFLPLFQKFNYDLWLCCY